MFQVYNITDNDVVISAGERIGQGVFIKYVITDNDMAEGLRTGGFGSTDMNVLIDAIFNPDSLKAQDLDEFLKGTTK